MKTCWITLAGLIALVATASAQPEPNEERYLLGDADVSGAFGSFFIELTDFDGQTGSFSGGDGALVFNNHILIGGYGQGLNGDVRVRYADETGTPRESRIDMRHGGFLLGGIIAPKAAVHPIVYTRLGWGRVDFVEEGVRDRIFAITPTAGIQANIASWIRLDLTAGYRIITGLDSSPVANDFLNGLTGMLGIRIGGFYSRDRNKWWWQNHDRDDDRQREDDRDDDRRD